MRIQGLSPRLRGNPNQTAGIPQVLGSIPALAGEPAYGLCEPWPGGSIPALAGEPKGRQHSLAIYEVYPRACGGTSLQRLSLLHDSGLSPRLRGNRHTQGLTDPDDRSIPALAGEPQGGPPVAQCTAVYPRACGGTQINLFRAVTRYGLSPRLRGNPSGPKAWSTRIRSIPALAGEPSTPGA